MDDEDFFAKHIYGMQDDEMAYVNAWERYELLTTAYIINRLIQYGKDANDVTTFFPAYDVAVKCRKKGDEATVKQHNAMAHVLAYIDTIVGAPLYLPRAIIGAETGNRKGKVIPTKIWGKPLIQKYPWEKG
jgi:hypothetical protein